MIHIVVIIAHFIMKSSCCDIVNTLLSELIVPLNKNTELQIILICTCDKQYQLSIVNENHHFQADIMLVWMYFDLR